MPMAQHQKMIHTAFNLSLAADAGQLEISHFVRNSSHASARSVYSLSSQHSLAHVRLFMADAVHMVLYGIRPGQFRAPARNLELLCSNPSRIQQNCRYFLLRFLDERLPAGVLSVSTFSPRRARILSRYFAASSKSRRPAASSIFSSSYWIASCFSCSFITFSLSPSGVRETTSRSATALRTVCGTMPCSSL